MPRESHRAKVQRALAAYVEEHGAPCFVAGAEVARRAGLTRGQAGAVGRALGDHGALALPEGELARYFGGDWTVALG